MSWHRPFTLIVPRCTPVAIHSFPATTPSLRIDQFYAANMRPTNVSTIKANNELTDLIKLHLGRSGPVTFNHQYTRKRIHAMTGSSLATTPFSPAQSRVRNEPHPRCCFARTANSSQTWQSRSERISQSSHRQFFSPSGIPQRSVTVPKVIIRTL